MRRAIVLAAVLMLCGGAFAGLLGHTESFAGVGTNGWYGAVASNPGAGGVDGPADGYLRVQTHARERVALRSRAAVYQGDWTAAGVTEVRFHVADVGAPQPFELHFVVSGHSGSGPGTWMYTAGFHPRGEWVRCEVDLTAPESWVRLRGSASLPEILRNVKSIEFRHARAPFGLYADRLEGELGIDQFTLIPEPAGLVVAFILTLAGRGAMRRKLRAIA